jgi:hypothetical protein
MSENKGVPSSPSVKPIGSSKKIRVNDIFNRYYKEYCEKYKGHISPQQYRVINALTTCGTVNLGGHLYKCDSCDKYHSVYNSCKNRHCPACQSLKAAEWLLKRRSELLPVQYFHVVFTVPDALNPIFLQNKRIMYTLLFNSVSKTLLQLSKEKKYMGVGQIGFISVLHTWSQTLLDHPHLHTIVTGGGLSKDKKKWISGKKDYLINVKVMSQRFRNIFLLGLKELYKSKKLHFNGKIKKFKWKNIFQKLIDTLFVKSWVVHSEANYSDPKNIFDYLGRYVQKVAISNNRIIKLKDGKVHFSYKDYADNGKTKIMVLHADEFIRRFLLHVLPKRFVKIRYYGLLGFKNREKKLSLCRNLLGVEENICYEKEIPQGWKELYEFVTGYEIDRCPYCKKGKLIFVRDIMPQLKARGP